MSVKYRSFVKVIKPCNYTQHSAHQHFGFCIITSDAAHIITAGCFAMHIGHGAKLQCLLHTSIVDKAQ
jgi:hypothetical protein